jgi:hypothetical protein
MQLVIDKRLEEIGLPIVIVLVELSMAHPFKILGFKDQHTLFVPALRQPRELVVFIKTNGVYIAVFMVGSLLAFPKIVDIGRFALLQPTGKVLDGRAMFFIVVILHCGEDFAGGGKSSSSAFSFSLNVRGLSDAKPFRGILGHQSVHNVVLKLGFDRSELFPFFIGGEENRVEQAVGDREKRKRRPLTTASAKGRYADS